MVCVKHFLTTLPEPGMVSLLKVLFLALATLTTTSVASAQGYKVKQGDVLRIEVLEDDSLNRSVLVAPDGRISVPLVGTVVAGGRTLGAIQTDLVARLTPNFSTSPSVLVSLEQLAPRDPVTPTEDAVVAIFAMGEVANPGRIELVPGTRLLQALAQLGGFSDFAAVKRIQLRRTDPRTGAATIYPLNYEAIMSGRSANGQVEMQEGDVILVPTRRLFE